MLDLIFWILITSAVVAILVTTVQKRLRIRREARERLAKSIKELKRAMRKS